jgi:hypothetical protein
MQTAVIHADSLNARLSPCHAMADSMSQPCCLCFGNESRKASLLSSGSHACVVSVSCTIMHKTDEQLSCGAQHDGWLLSTPEIHKYHLAKSKRYACAGWCTVWGWQGPPLFCLVVHSMVAARAAPVLADGAQHGGHRHHRYAGWWCKAWGWQGPPSCWLVVHSTGAAWAIPWLMVHC